MAYSQRTAWIAGATGLVGQQALRLLLDSQRLSRVVSFTRRPIGPTSPRHENRVVSFDELPTRADPRPVDVALCCLGTTMKQAGSQAAFRRVDYEYVVTFARYAIHSGASHFLMVSALGASPKSRVFYNRVKGEAEQAVSELGFRQVTIVRPSLLLGERAEMRMGERLFAPFSKWLPQGVRGIEAETVARALVALSDRPTEGLRIVPSGELFAIAEKHEHSGAIC
ncbi:MAG: hypothetical protein RL385_797 [Pseudomonadota bacterium]|jgi:uncharacterized protein YbjT (DUF2867 family)